MKTKRVKQQKTVCSRKGTVYLHPLNEEYFTMTYVDHLDSEHNGDSSWYQEALKIDLEEGTLHILPLDKNRFFLLYVDAENEARFQSDDEDGPCRCRIFEGSLTIETEDYKPVLSSIYRCLMEQQP